MGPANFAPRGALKLLRQLDLATSSGRVSLPMLGARSATPPSLANSASRSSLAQSPSSRLLVIGVGFFRPGFFLQSGNDRPSGARPVSAHGISPAVPRIRRSGSLRLCATTLAAGHSRQPASARAVLGCHSAVGMCCARISSAVCALQPPRGGSVINPPPDSSERPLPIHGQGNWSERQR
jgi:hypothetical protein